MRNIEKRIGVDVNQGNLLLHWRLEFQVSINNMNIGYELKNYPIKLGNVLKIAVGNVAFSY